MLKTRLCLVSEMNISEEVKDEFLKWMQEDHLEDLYESGFFTKEMRQSLPIPELGGKVVITTFPINLEAYNTYERERDGMQKWVQARFAQRWKEKIGRGKDIELLSFEVRNEVTTS